MLATTRPDLHGRYPGGQGASDTYSNRASVAEAPLLLSLCVEIHMGILQSESFHRVSHALLI